MKKITINTECCRFAKAQIRRHYRVRDYLTIGVVICIDCELYNGRISRANMRPYIHLSSFAIEKTLKSATKIGLLSRVITGRNGKDNKQRGHWLVTDYGRLIAREYAKYYRMRLQELQQMNDSQPVADTDDISFE